MSFEGGPTQEQIREAYIIEELKNTSPEKLVQMMHEAPTEASRKNAQDPEKIKEYLAWDDEWRSLIQAIDGEEGERQILNCEIKRSELYIAAGLTALAKETLECAQEMAYAMGNDIAYEDIDTRLKGLEEGLRPWE